jgi:N6-L-threonylcarbamoyladenine synthase
VTLILGIETSCDETAAAVVEDGTRVRSNVIASQHDLHERYGGVVPEIASRAHLERISPVIDQALREAAVTFDDIAAIAVGNRPGLIGSLLVGVSAAKTLAWSLDKPLVGVDHIRAHLHAAALDQQPPQYPAIGMVVSGGHSNLYRMTSPLDMELIGCTIDDAVGEAYDKAAVILDAGYPGGPMLDKLAQQGSPGGHNLPVSLLAADSLDFSFSGLKTALLYTVRGRPQGRGRSATFERSAADLTDEQKRNLAAAFQHAAIDALMIKLRRAIDRHKPAGVIIGGGVSANSLLRSRLAGLTNVQVHIPQFAHCLDNAAMIAGLAYHQLQSGQTDDLHLAAIATTDV